MTTCANIIQSAYRRSQVIGARVAINADLQTIGLERLRGMYQRMINGLLGQLTDYYLSSGAYTAIEQQRIYKASGASVITIPTTVTDLDTGTTRVPKDGAAIVVVDPTGTDQPKFWVYNAMLGKWQELMTLALTDVAPLTSQFEEALKDMLACLLADENGIPVGKTLSSNAALGKLAIASRYQSASVDNVGIYY